MSYTHLKDHPYYENLYDNYTVELGRRNIVHYNKFLTDFEKKLPPDETIEKPGNALLLNAFYMQVLGFELVERYANRDTWIQERMAEDQAKNDQLAAARLSGEPICRHCDKQGLRIIDKSFMRRSESHDWNDPEDVLFMLRCLHCEKNSAVWEDGSAWIPKATPCPNCHADMEHSSKSTAKYITFINSCTACGRVAKDKISLEPKMEAPDPDFEKDRHTYCLLDDDFRHYLFELKHGFEGFAELGRQMKEKEDNKHIYEAMENIRKLKIAELASILSPALEQAGYINFSLDKPNIGRDVYIGFCCLDAKSERDDDESRKVLKKTLTHALADTNWRLMSDGIQYRLGYLSGRLRAYEREDDLSNLIEKRAKDRHEPTLLDSKGDVYKDRRDEK